MLRARGVADFQRLGPRQFGSAPTRGAIVDLPHDGQTIRARVAEIFIPPGCEENCIGTVFLSED